jgi:hypothetical protein
MIEAGVLIGQNNSVLHWHTPNERSVGFIPDSRDLWQIIWDNKDSVTGFAHTHPGSGPPGPSSTDISTFIAVEKALGKHLNWFILSKDSQILCLFDNPPHEPPSGIIIVDLNTEDTINMTWTDYLRELSHY